MYRMAYNFRKEAMMNVLLAEAQFWKGNIDATKQYYAMALLSIKKAFGEFKDS